MNQNDIVNKSGIAPVGHRVLLQPEEVQKVSAGGIVLPMESVERDELAQCFGRVVAVGPEAWFDRTSLVAWLLHSLGLRKPWAKPGDRVIFGKYAGLIFPGNDGGKYRLINDRDVVAVVAEMEINHG